MASAYIAWYLFFAGAGAGAFVIGALVDFALRICSTPWLAKVSPVTDFGLLAGPILVAAGSIFLLLDLGDPSLAFNVFLNPSSVLGFGSWSIVLFCGCSLFALLIGLFLDGVLSSIVETVLQSLALIAALAVVLYSGVFYSLFSSVPFLHTPIIPVLFALSAFASGIGVLVLSGFFRQSIEGVKEGLGGLSKADILIVIAELLVLASLLVRPIVLSDANALASTNAVVSGDFSYLFWVGVVFFGIAIPLATDFASFFCNSSMVLCLGAISSLVGGVSLRFCLLMAATRLSVGLVGAQLFWA